MDKITAFKTSDGKLWLSQDEASTHEARQELNKVLSPIIRGEELGLVVSTLLNNAPTVEGVLRRYSDFHVATAKEGD